MPFRKKIEINKQDISKSLEDSNTSLILSWIINSPSKLIWFIDQDLCYTYFNNNLSYFLETYYDFKPEIGNKILSSQTKYPELDKLKDLYERGLKGESIKINFEVKGFIAEIQINPIIDHNNNCIGIAIFGKDVTQIIKNEEQIIESERKYKTVVESLNDIVFQTDTDGNWTFLNKSWERVFGYTVKESLGKPLNQFLHPDDVQRNIDLFEPLVSKKKSYCDHEIRYISKSGEILTIKIYAVSLHNNNGEIIGTSGTLKDITEQKRNKEMYQLLSENVRDMIIIHSLNGTISYATPSSYVLVGYTSEELIGKDLHLYIHPDDIRSITLFQQSIIIDSNNQESNLISYRFKHKNGHYLWLETSSKAIKDTSRNTINIIASSRIIDERKKLEESLIESLVKEKELNELKSRFVSMASHELRTPMATIKSSTEILYIRSQQMQDISMQESLNKHLSIINTEVDRLTTLMNDVLLLGKIEAVKVNFKPTKTNLQSLIEQTVARLSNKLIDNRILKMEFIGETRDVIIDPVLFNHILENIISNAFKYSINSKAPELTLTLGEKLITLEILDYGIGIPKDEEKQIFGSFFRARNADLIQGTGLGLVIVKNFVQMHGGKIRFKSEEGIGTVFTVEIPC
jgi:PAS domain S-box-containing protein